MAAAPLRLHGTAIAAGGRAALIRGPSGSGKSDLALRCITAPVSPLLPHRAELVADDQVELEANSGGIIVRAPATLRALLEVRGLGIVNVAVCTDAPLALAVDLVPRDRIDRLPDPAPTVEIAGVVLPVLRLDPFEAAAPQKLLLRLLLCD